MAVPRVLSVVNDNNGLTCPTGEFPPIESKVEIPTLSNRKNGSHLSQHMKHEHKRMSRMLGYCLTADDSKTWAGFSVVAFARLSSAERVSLAFSALNSLSTQTAVSVSAAVIGQAGDPLPSFLGGMSDAKDWAAIAGIQELKAYALAAFEALPLEDQMSFRRHISEVEIAA